MKLSEVCEINPRSQAISDNTLISFVAMPDVSEDGRINTSVVRPYGEVKKGYTIFQEGDVLFAKITPCMENGKGAQALGLKNGIGVGSTEFHILRPNPDLLDGMWLYYLTAWPTFRHEAEIHMTGSAGQKRVPRSFLEGYQIGIPTLNKQKDQVSQLNRIRRIIESRQRQLRALDTLIKARFVEMFGDPESNPHDWEKIPLSEIITNANNGMARRGNDPDGSIVMRLVELQDGFIDYSRPNRTMLNEAEKSRYLLVEKDFLFARVNGNPDNVGRCAVFRDIGEPVYHNDHIIRVHFDERLLDGTFASALINSTYGKRQMRAQIKTSAGQYTISQDGIGAIVAIVPPIELQDQFAAFVSQVDKSKIVVQRALERAQVLFDSLMQEYFG